jgi:exosortase
MPPLPTLAPPDVRRVMPTILVLLAAILWATWSVLGEMSSKWAYDPTYSHGYLVPLVVLLVLWVRRDSRPVLRDRPCWWALGWFALGGVMQYMGAYYYVRWISGASLVAYAAGVAMLVGGWRGLRWSAPAIAFLFFMIPLPYRFEAMMRSPLRKASTLASSFTLQTLGLPAVSQGNVILLSNGTETFELGVVDACSGLKMLIVFFCMTTAFALLVRRSLGERILIVLSTLPIALACNVARITLTGICYVTLGEKWANLVFHDLAGWLMMPMALGLLWLELKLLERLFIEDTPDDRPAFRLNEVLPVQPQKMKTT